jgi:ribonuclease VapC
VIVVDTSALIAILFREPDAERFAAALADEARAVIGAATSFEFLAVSFRKLGAAGLGEARQLLDLSSIGIISWTEEHLERATKALVRYGGRPARLNYGDCMAYAVAKSLDAPLLFKGDDFRHTDIRAVL